MDIDLILHPIRMRILLALVNRDRTAQQLLDAMQDVPQATLYRHLHRLAEAGVIQVAAERPARGVREKVYSLGPAASRSAETSEGIPQHEHMRMYLAFLASLLDDFNRYLQSSDRVDLLADGVSYSKVALELSEAEFQDLLQTMSQAVLAHLHNQPAPERTRRIFASIILPDSGQREGPAPEAGLRDNAREELL